MAVFKSLKPKSKEYAFKFGGNEKLKRPATAVFARFPLPDENFLKPGSDTRYNDVDWDMLGKKDQKELEKLFSAFINNYVNDTMNNAMNDAMKDAGSDVRAIMPFGNVNYQAFLRECVERFDNLFAESEDGKKAAIRTVDDFLSLPEAAVYEISKDLYAYAREKEDFTMGESKA